MHVLSGNMPLEMCVLESLPRTWPPFMCICNWFPIQCLHLRSYFVYPLYNWLEKIKVTHTLAIKTYNILEINFHFLWLPLSWYRNDSSLISNTVKPFKSELLYFKSSYFLYAVSVELDVNIVVDEVVAGSHKSDWKLEEHSVLL